MAQEDGALRLAVLSFQGLCLLVVFLSMVLVYHFRRNKVGATAAAGRPQIGCASGHVTKAQSQRSTCWLSLVLLLFFFSWNPPGSISQGSVGTSSTGGQTLLETTSFTKESQ